MFPMTRTNKTLVDCLIAIVAALLIAGIVGAADPQFRVHNRMSEFSVKNCCAPANVEYRAVRTFIVRAPRGHTHTCRNGHTWDHAANSSHTCQFCGASQYVVDPSPRMVTVEKVVYEPNKVKVEKAVLTVTATPQAAFSSVYSIPGASVGGCANGQCSTVQAPTKFRLFR